MLDSLLRNLYRQTQQNRFVLEISRSQLLTVLYALVPYRYLSETPTCFKRERERERERDRETDRERDTQTYYLLFLTFFYVFSTVHHGVELFH